MLAEPVQATAPAPEASGVSVPAGGVAAFANGVQTQATATTTATPSIIVRILPRKLTRRECDTAGRVLTVGARKSSWPGGHLGRRKSGMRGG